MIDAIYSQMASVETSTVLSSTDSPLKADSIQNISYQSIFIDGLNAVEEKLNTTAEKVREFALNDDIPVHEVMIAMEETRLMVELTMQVRNRVVEAYRDVMNIQI
ncbi:flagellar hook-basal body complex protein FliE [Woodsholea maritima]|uniref:flagellar hook-basal body complex protein FliE n=1 Tax=Woodsholea maritima TaxID=240237 RepID=UPI00037986D7|nr:flagellar hook-basal body complex protein FliE [Woodsholea maritima]